MIRLKFYGLGGQGVVTAAKVLSAAVSIHEGKYAVTIPAYGHERRGAPVYTDVVVDNEPILLNCFVYEPDIVLVMDPSVREKNIDVGKGKHDGAVLVLNTKSEREASEYMEQYGFQKAYYTDAVDVALKWIRRPIPNGAMLGALSKTGLVSIESVMAALKETFGEKAGDKNANAAREAYERTCEM